MSSLIKFWPLLLLLVAASSSDYRSDESDYSTDDSYSSYDSNEDDGESVKPGMQQPQPQISSQGPNEEGPRLSGNSLNVNTNEILPSPWEAIHECVYRYGRTRFNTLPPADPTNGGAVFFWDLENTLYMAKTLQGRLIDFYTDFLTKQMKVTEKAELKDWIYNKRDQLEQMMSFKKVTFDPTYSFIKPDPTVTDVISNMKAQHWIFTNSSLDHTMKVLKLMDIDKYFTGIIFRPYDSGLGKTQKVFYQTAMLAAGVQRATDCYFIDDGVINIFMAKNMKWRTALYYSTNYHPKLMDVYGSYQHKLHRIGGLRHLAKVFPELFDNPEKILKPKPEKTFGLI